jgi:oligosaccharide repeat unit polymerase
LELFTNCVATLFVIHFCWSYYWNCYRQGYTMDIWHWTLLSLVFTIHVMLPFSRSDLNVFALGGLLRKTQAHVNEAYLISALGYFSILAGGQLWRLHSGVGLRRAAARTLEWPARLSLSLLNSRRMLRLHGLGAVTAMGAMILIYWKVMGFGFAVGELTLGNPGLRPFGNFATFYGNVIASYCLVRALRYREPEMIALVVAMLVELLFFGSRSSLLGVASLVLVIGMVRMRRRLKLQWLALGLLGGVFLAILLDGLRRPNFSLQRVLAGFTLSVFYGNSFSDTRDFALILSCWNGTYLWGKTYLAALIAFVPQSFSTFRTEWSLGVVTATMAGFSTQEHAGFRVGVVGEAFLNFGLPGVILMGLFFGATLRLIDAETKRALRLLPLRDLRVYSFSAIALVAAVAQNTSLASTFYTTILLLWFSWIGIRMLGWGGATRLEATAHGGS